MNARVGTGCPGRSFVLALLLVVNAAYAEVTLTHVHGLSYSADGKQIYIPSHHGLAIYANGRWSMAPGPAHDYMGFSGTRNALYSSGHPAPGTGLTNPFGLIKSLDQGKTWQRLGLEGESDFHILATGYNTNAVYVYTNAPNSRMKVPGLHYTVNDGFVWQRARARGLAGELRAVAVHPTNPAIVAAATNEGLYLSEDRGDSFRVLGQRREVFTAFFDLDGKRIWSGGYVGRALLAQIDWATGKENEVRLPQIDRDAVAYMGQNPVDRDAYAIATFERNVYVTRDAGRSWRQIAERGRGQ